MAAENGAMLCSVLYVGVAGDDACCKKYADEIWREAVYFFFFFLVAGILNYKKWSTINVTIVFLCPPISEGNRRKTFFPNPKACLKSFCNFWFRLIKRYYFKTLLWVLWLMQHCRCALLYSYRSSEQLLWVFFLPLQWISPYKGKAGVEALKKNIISLISQRNKDTNYFSEVE